MVPLTPARHRVYCCVRPHLLLIHWTRAFHSGLVTCLDDAAIVKAVRPSVTITKKKFSELPKRRVVAKERSLQPALAEVQSPSDTNVPNDLVLPSCAQF